MAEHGGGRGRSRRRMGTELVHIVGRCAVCRVAFAAEPGAQDATRMVLRVHEQVCPGGNRLRETVMPLAALGDDPSGAR
jgi:hypothetical protein